MPKKPDTRYENNYRYSDAFIQKATNWLVAMVFIGPALGALMAFIGSTIYGSDFPLWLTVIALTFTFGGIALPLLVGAWFGGQSIHRFGGWVGLLLMLGLGATVAGQGMDTGWMFASGIATMVLAGLLFFYLGFQAKVPMWLQLPILGSPRAYLTKNKQTKTKSTAKKKQDIRQ